MYGEVEAPPLDPAPAAAGKALAVLDVLVQIANTCLVAYPGEGMLHKQVSRAAAARPGVGWQQQV